MAKHKVAIVGCGRMGQIYAQAYSTFPDTEIVAIAEANPQRLQVLGERFSVTALYPHVNALLNDIVPDIVAIVTPSKYMKDAVIACAEAGVKGVSTDKPLAARLSDADEMVRVCQQRGVVYGGGNLQRAMHEVQEAARRLHEGQFGPMVGAAVHGFGSEISGGGCQHISVLRLFTGSEVDQVIAWGMPPEAMERDDDEGLIVNGIFKMSNGMDCPVYGTGTEESGQGIDVWTDTTLIRWNWAPPQIFQGFDAGGKRVPIEPHYQPYQWSEFEYLTGSIRSFLAAVEMGSKLWISGHDLRQALEVAIACKLSAQLGSVTVKLPLEDRSLALYPRSYRWVGGDEDGSPQAIEEAAGRERSS